jgi:cytochrome c oxidase subunit 1
MYLISIVAAFVLGGLLALIIRAEHMSGTPTIIDADTYNQVFTLHGAVMTFLFIIPGIPAALGNFVLPIMLGAKDVAFPRLNLASLVPVRRGLAAGVLLSIVLGRSTPAGPSTRPTARRRPPRVIPITLGAFILGFSSIFTGLNFIVTIHKMRPRA